MSCTHKIKWSVRMPEKCRFNLSVSHYKDRIVAPAEYTGATEVTPSDDTQVLATKDKLVRDDITVNPAPEPDLEPLTIDILTQRGTFLPTGDGFSQVTVEEQWDGILLPPPDGLGFYIKQVLIHPGERLKIEGYGHGGRWWAIRAGGGTQNRNNGFGNNFGVLTANNDPHVLISYTSPPFIYDTLVNIGGYEWRNDGGRYTDSGADPAAIYEFRGEYLKWKIIHAS